MDNRKERERERGRPQAEARFVLQPWRVQSENQCIFAFCIICDVSWNAWYVESFVKTTFTSLYFA